jgi:hypothetical protein
MIACSLFAGSLLADAGRTKPDEALAAATDKARYPRQGIRIHFDKSAPSLELPDAEVRLGLVGHGRPGNFVRAGAATLKTSGNRVEYQRGTLTEWYVNEKDGIEQGFTLAERPAGEGALMVELSVDGGLSPVMRDGYVSIGRDGTGMLRYGGLKAWDAAGKILPARMEVTGIHIVLAIDDAGAHYPVTIDPWIQGATLTGSSSSSITNYFGCSIAIDGDTALVGADGADSQGNNAVYVFGRSGTSWTLQSELPLPVGEDGTIYFFGHSVALQGDTALVGAYGYANDQKGAAFVYVRSGGQWTQQAELTADDVYYLGWSVALSGDTAIVGTESSAYIYVRQGTQWTQQTALSPPNGNGNASFGWSLSLSGDTALVGALNATGGLGYAYIYVRNSGVWTLQATFGPGGDSFAISVAVSGNVALVADEHQAYVYARDGDEWTQQATLNAGLSQVSGTSVSLSGSTAAWGYVGITSGGGVVLFSENDGVWTEAVSLTPSAPIYALALYENTLMAGDPGNSEMAPPGSVYVYSRMPELQINPGKLAAGGAGTVSGLGFAAGETIMLEWRNPQTLLGTASADQYGNFSGISFTVPASAPKGTNAILGLGETAKDLGLGYVVVP